jgi:hypothetical protein
LAGNLAVAQKPIDEEKIKKAVVLMQKMMEAPGQMQTVMTEMQALNLSGAEKKSANKGSGFSFEKGRRHKKAGNRYQRYYRKANNNL